jgi:hypothetical protein
MNISYRPQAERGVTQLMYVGDDEAVDKAVAPRSLVPGVPNLVLLAGVGIVAYLLLGRKKRGVRTPQERVAHIRTVARSRR